LSKFDRNFRDGIHLFRLPLKNWVQQKRCENDTQELGSCISNRKTWNTSHPETFF